MVFRYSKFTIVLLLLGSCSPEQEAPSFSDGDYLAHLKLASTTLVATTVIDHLEVPWEVAWGSDQRLWFTEQNGAVHRLDPESGHHQVMLRIPDVHFQKSRGLLGMALAPDFEAHPYVFLHYTYLIPDPKLNKNIESRLVRYTIDGDTLTDPLVLLDAIPGKTFHNGSRILITPDGYLFLSTGDAGNMDKPLDPAALEGKILRFHMDGSIPADNPVAGSPVWSWGHRNPQGLAWGNDRLYASEHGPATDDEINLIRKGGNYGWPAVHGYCDKKNEEDYCRDSNVVEPLHAWTPTIAAAGLAYYDHPAIPEWRNSLLLANMKGQALRALRLNTAGDAISAEHIFFQQHFGRLRAVCAAPNGDIYLSTSNGDWHPRFQPFLYDTARLIRPGDDRIIRLRAAGPADLELIAQLPQTVPLVENPAAEPMPTENWNLAADESELALGERLYQQQCTACHRSDGAGMPGQFPPLADTEWVTGSKDRLIALVLRGLSEPIEVDGITYEQEMPGFAVLDDEEIAAILSFIRQSWGNNAGAVSAAEVAEERKLMMETL